MRYNTQFTVSDEISADDITQIIMDEYEGILIERCVKNRYNFLEPEEQDVVLKKSKMLAKESKGGTFPSYEERRSRVYRAVCEYLKENDTIVPGGFIDFRMREIYYYVENIVSLGADLFFEEREYEEFTYLLSVFLAEKESKEEVLHLVWHENDIRLINKRGRDVSVKYEKEFYNAAREKGMGKEDLAISAVISAAPKRLIFHNAPHSSPLKETLIKIFDGRCKTCPGCNICKKS